MRTADYLFLYMGDSTHTSHTQNFHPLDIENMPLRWGHFKILIVASMGQMLGAGLSTLVGIILPMIQMVIHPELSSWQQGLVGCTSLIGITIGSVVIGKLSDRYGYLSFFKLCPLIVLLASCSAFFTDNLWGLYINLLFMGFGIGGEYSLDSNYISELMPQRWRTFMVGVAKASSSVGYITMALICYYLLHKWQNPQFWNHLLLLISGTSMLMFLLRLSFKESPGWLLMRGKYKEANNAVTHLLGKDVMLRDHKSTSKQNYSFHLFSDGNWKKVIFTGMPWACEGFGIYGLGVFTPILLLSLGLAHDNSPAALPIDHITQSVLLTSEINVFILIGFILGLLCINKFHHVKMQMWGFILCAIGLLLLLCSYHFRLSARLSIAGFMIFQLFINAGPHLLTFVMPSEVYPIEERGAGAGIAAAIGKIGAVVGVLFIPIILERLGGTWLLIICVGTQLLGAFVTRIFGYSLIPTHK